MMMNRTTKHTMRRTPISSSVASIACCLFATQSSICLLSGSIADASLQPSQTSSKLQLSPNSLQATTNISLKRRSSSIAAGWNILQSIPRGGSSIAVDDGSEDMSEEEELSSDLSEGELSDESEDETPSTTSNSSGPPIKLTIKTNLASTLIDQKLDFTASRTRSIQSIKLAISKSMVGRPPLSSIILKYHGRALDDEECMFDLLEDLDSDDEEDSDLEDNIGEEEDEDTIKVTLTADILPPIDTKFGIELKEKLHKLSTQEILEAYCVNMAGMVYGQELFVKESELYENNDENEGLDDEDMELHTSSTSTTNENHSLNIRKKAALIQSQFESNLSSETKQLLQEEHIRVKQHLSSDSTSTSSKDDSDEIIYGLISQNEINSSSSRKGRRRTLKGGASMNVKRSLQRNLNVVRIVLFSC